MKKLLTWTLILAGVAAIITPRAVAQTDGSVVFKCTTVNTENTSYDPKHVLAVWVETAAGVHVKTLQRQAGDRMTHLNAWEAVNPSHTVTPDAVTGATLNNHNTPLNLTWNCRNTSGTLVADGSYRIRCEFTEKNSTGPITTTAPLTFTKGPTAVNLTPANLPNFKTMSLVYTPLATPHDVAVTSISPAQGQPNSTVNMTVGLRNLTTTSENITVVLSNLTSRVKIGEAALNPFAGSTTNKVIIAWNTAGVTNGTYALKASVAPIAGETVVANNVLQQNIIIAPIIIQHDVAVTSISPAQGLPDSTVNVTVGLRNQQAASENITVVLSNLTSNAKIGEATLNPFAGNTSNKVIIAWNTAGVLRGTYTLQASVAPILGENVITNNVRQSSIFIARIVRDPAVVALRPLGEATLGDVVPVVADLYNRGTEPETVTVNLTVDGGGTVATATATNLPSGAQQDLILNWKTFGAAVGNHTLRGQSVTLTGETNLANNAAVATGVVSETGIGLADIQTIGSVGGFSAAVALSGTTLCVGQGSTLTLLDITTPAAPVRLGELRLAGKIEALSANLNYIYAACGPAGVQVVNGANTQAPTLVQTIATSGHAWDVAAFAGPARIAMLAVADGVMGVRLYTMTTPTAPSLTSVFPTFGPARRIMANGTGNALYVLDYYRGLQIITIAVPATPTLVGSYNRVAMGSGLATSGNTCAIVDGLGKLYVLSLAAPAAPVLLSSTNLNMAATAVAVSGTKIYVTGGQAGVDIVDITAPAAPNRLARLDTPGTASDVLLSGSNLFVADGFGGLQVVNVAAPAAPTLAGAYNPTARGNGMAVDGSVLFVASGASGLRAYSITNAARPTLLGTCADCNSARDVVVNGSGTAFVADGAYGVRVLNVTDPAAMTVLGTYSNASLSAVTRIGLNGTRLALTDGRLVGLLDVSAPATPALLAYTAITTGYVYEVAMAGADVVAAAGSAGVLVLRAGGGSLSTLARYDTGAGTRATGVRVFGTRAYVATGNRWIVLDLTNPATPILHGAQNLPQGVAGVALSGNLAQFIDGGRGLTTVDVADPLNPLTRDTFANLTAALRVAAGYSEAFVGEDDAGVAILDAYSPNADADTLPDNWEQQIVDADPNDSLTTVGDVQAGEDFDGDGASNEAELGAGTDPTKADSIFVITAVQYAPAGGACTVRWNSVYGRTYTVHKCTNLGDGFTPLAQHLLATPAVNSYSDTTAAGGRAFYMVTVDP